MHAYVAQEPPLPQRLSSEAIEKQEAFVAAALLLCGETKWLPAVARLLGPHHPECPRKAIDLSDVRSWAAGASEVPAWAVAVLACLVRERGERMTETASELERLALMLARSGALAHHVVLDMNPSGRYRRSSSAHAT